MVHDTRSSAPDFSRLLQQARQGDAEALNSLLALCRQYMLLIANQEVAGHLKAKQAPSDFVQTALTRAAENFQQFQGNNETALLGWMRAILKNELQMGVRRFEQTQKRDVRREHDWQQVRAEDARRVAPLLDQHLTPATEAQQREEAQILRDAVLALPPIYREVVMLRNWERLPFAEIGLRLGRSENAIKKLWARALADLGRAFRHAEQTHSRPLP